MENSFPTRYESSETDVKRSCYEEWNMEEWGETNQGVAHHGVSRSALIGTRFTRGFIESVVVKKQKETNRWFKRYGWIEWWR